MGTNIVMFRGIEFPPVQQPWLRRHHEALQRPRESEAGIVALRAWLLQYAVSYTSNYEGLKLGEDRYLGAALLVMAEAYLKLLNGSCGRLDCGTLDGEIRRWAEQHGFSAEQVEAL